MPFTKGKYSVTVPYSTVPFRKQQFVDETRKELEVEGIKNSVRSIFLDPD
jgi:hypothetical protein